MGIFKVIKPILKQFGSPAKDILHKLGAPATKTNVAILNHWCEQIALAENYRCSQIIQKESLRCQEQGRSDLAAELNRLYVAIGYHK